MACLNAMHIGTAYYIGTDRRAIGNRKLIAGSLSIKNGLSAYN